MLNRKFNFRKTSMNRATEADAETAGTEGGEYCTIIK